MGVGSGLSKEPPIELSLWTERYRAGIKVISTSVSFIGRNIYEPLLFPFIAAHSRKPSESTENEPYFEKKTGVSILHEKKFEV